MTATTDRGSSVNPAPSQNDESDASYRALLPLCRPALRVLLTISAIAVADIFVSLMLSVVVSESQYLSWYLSDSEPEVISTFLAGEGILIPDEVAGWKNHPNWSQGTWVTDENGARSTYPVSVSRGEKERILLLGSSVINGGLQVTSEETLDAFLENASVETINFGTMLYSVDQSLLAYRNGLAKYRPDWLVVGVHAEVDALANFYIPFRNRAEEFIPLVKPRFRLAGDRLELIAIEPGRLVGGDAQKRELLQLTRDEDDSFFYFFESYRRLGLMPFSSGLRRVLIKFWQLDRAIWPEPGNQELQLEVMKALDREARSNGAKVLFICFARQEDFSPSSPVRMLGRTRERHVRALEASGLEILDVKDVLESTDRAPKNFFFEAGVHMKPEANRLIADAIRERLGLAGENAGPS